MPAGGTSGGSAAASATASATTALTAPVPPSTITRSGRSLAISSAVGPGSESVRVSRTGASSRFDNGVAARESGQSSPEASSTVSAPPGQPFADTSAAVA